MQLEAELAKLQRRLLRTQGVLLAVILVFSACFLLSMGGARIVSADVIDASRIVIRGTNGKPRIEIGPIRAIPDAAGIVIRDASGEQERMVLADEVGMLRLEMGAEGLGGISLEVMKDGAYLKAIGSDGGRARLMAIGKSGHVTADYEGHEVLRLPSDTPTTDK